MRFVRYRANKLYHGWTDARTGNRKTQCLGKESVWEGFVERVSF